MWEVVQAARSFELVVYRLPHGSEDSSTSEIELSGADEVLYERVPGGATGWTPAAVDCLFLISYYDATNDNLKVARCTNADCAPAVSTTLDLEGGVGSHRSIAVGLDGRAWISYSGGGLKVAHLPFGY